MCASAHTHMLTCWRETENKHIYKLISESDKCHEKNKTKVDREGTSLVAQWLGIRLPMQGTRVRALAQEDPTCRGATKPVRHNY